MRATDQTYFFHLRMLTEDGCNISPMGGVTAAFRYNDVGNEITYALSVCSEKDNFEKRVGRIKAEGRLNSPKLRVRFQIAPEATVSDVINDLRNEMAHTVTVCRNFDLTRLV